MTCTLPWKAALPAAALLPPTRDRRKRHLDVNMIGQIQQEIPESTDDNVVDNLAAADAVVPLSLFTDALLCNRFDGKNKNLSVAEVETV